MTSLVMLVLLVLGIWEKQWGGMGLTKTGV